MGRGPLDEPGAPLMARHCSKPTVENRAAAAMPGLGQTLPCLAGFTIGEVGALDTVGPVMGWLPWAVREVAAGACES